MHLQLGMLASISPVARISSPGKQTFVQAVLLDGYESNARLNEVLRPLTGLTGLALMFISASDEWPCSLTRLTQLQWLCIQVRECPQVALPAGDWTNNLRRLAVEFRTAAASLPQLAAAQHLSHLSLMDVPEKGEGEEQLGQWEAFWRFAATHPPLQRLYFQSADEGNKPSGNVPACVLEACVQLATMRLSLQVGVRDEDLWRLLEDLKDLPLAAEGEG